ncbi:MAG: PAS domain S-box protein, partial [Salinivirgaceae bacterium]
GKTRWVREKGVVEFDELNKPVGAIGVVQDITQKKQHEAELKAQKDEYYSLFEEYRVINEDLLITKELAEANEKQFRLLADNAPQAIFIQLGSHFAYVNQAAVELYGAKSKEDLLGTLIIDRIEDSYKEIVKERIRQLNENKIKVAVNEYQHLTLDGNSVDVSVSAVPFTYNNSDGALVFVQNISDRKAAEQKLTESERMLKLFVKHAPAAIAMFDTEMRYLAVSDRYLRDYKLKGNSLVGHSHYEVFPEIDDEWKKLHKKALNGSVEKRDEDPFKRADGSLDWIRWELRPWFTSGNTIGGIILFSEVITERRNSELKAKEQQLLFETMFNAISDGIVITDTDRNIKLANKGMFNTFGYLPGELVGKSTRMLYADDQVFADTGEAVFKKEATSPENLYLTYYKNKWSQVFPGETFGTKLYDNSGTWIGNLGIMRNISERVNYIEALKQRNAELLTAEEEIRAHNEQLYDTVEKLHKSELELMKSSFFFEQLYMQSAISTQLLDNEGWCVRINPKLSELFGVAPESIEGRKYNIFNDREIIEKGIIAYLKRVFEYKEQVSWEVAFDISNASESTGVKVSKGGKKWFFCKAYPILDESENLVNVIIQHIDIDARKQAETELNKSEKQLQHIFDNSPAIMFLLNNDMEIVRFNKTSTEFSGIDPKKIMQSRQGYLLNCINSLNEPHKCGQTDNCANCSLHKTVQQSIKNHETMMKVKTEMNLVKNGQRAHFTFLVSSSIVIFDKELLYLVTLEDITELKKMEQALLNTVIQTEESERKRIAQDLHDGIGPLLSTVKLYAQTYINSKNRELKNTIKEQFLSTLNDAINQVSLISNNLSPHVLNDFGLNAAIQRIIDKTQFVYPITFDYSFLLKNELKPEYNITLYRLVLELINNTLKHAQASLIKIHIEERNQILYLDFMNNGKIFNFEKSKNAGKGMGLFNIISRIQSLGGKVTFNAGKEQGVTYLMEIPL